MTDFKPVYRMYLGNSKTFVSPKEIRFRQNGTEKVKVTKPIVRDENGEMVEPLLIAEFSEHLEMEVKASFRKGYKPTLSDFQKKMINFFQNFFLTNTGLKLQSFFVTRVRDNSEESPEYSFTIEGRQELDEKERDEKLKEVDKQVEKVKNLIGVKKG